MTDTAVETVETEATEAPVETGPKSTGDPTRDAIIASIVDLIQQANASVARIGSATTDLTKNIHEYLTDPNTSDEKIAAFQKWEEDLLAKYEAAKAQAYEHAKAQVEKNRTDSPVDVDAEKVTYKTLAGKAKTAISFYVDTLPGTSESDLEGIPALKTLRGGTASGGSGSKRPRVQRISVRNSPSENWTAVEKAGKNAKGEDVVTTNFTVLAQHLSKDGGAKVEPKDLQAAAFEAAGTDDLNSLEGKVFEFAYTVGEKNYFVQVQPKGESDD